MTTPHYRIHVFLIRVYAKKYTTRSYTKLAVSHRFSPGHTLSYWRVGQQPKTEKATKVF